MRFLKAIDHIDSVSVESSEKPITESILDKMLAISKALAGISTALALLILFIEK